MITYIPCTTETRLDRHTNPELYHYLDAYLPVYSQVSRYMWYAIQDPDFDAKYKGRSQFISHVCLKFNLLKRTVNSLYYDVNGRISALKALKKHELKQLKHQITALMKREKKLKKQINTIKKRASLNKIVDAELIVYRKCKTRLFYLQRKLNKKRMQLVVRTEALNQRLKLCFGTKQLFNAQYHLSDNGFKSHTGWYNAFIKNRDKNIFYMGSRDETCGNQMMQLLPNIKTGGFDIRLRQEKDFATNGNYVLGHCDFCYLKDELLSMLLFEEFPLTVRFKRRNNQWYLQVVVAVKTAKACTTTSNGTLGLDYNEGFLELAETDSSGNLMGLQHFDLIGDSATTRNNALCVVVKEIAKQAVAKGKTVVIEDLNFNTTKSKTIPAISRSGKRYNRMIHQLDYSRYKDRMSQTGIKFGVDVLLIDPQNTSKIAKQKYCQTKKLTTHQGASYVIARRGQGFTDRLAI